MCTRRGHAHESFDIASSSVPRNSGVDVNLGRRRAWCRCGGAAPDGIRELCEEVWQGDAPPRENGIVVLDTPFGSVEFAEAFLEARLAEERSLLDRILMMDDLRECLAFAFPVCGISFESLVAGFASRDHGILCQAT